MHRRASIDQRASSAKDPKFAIRRLFAYLKPYTVQLLVVTVLLVIYTVMGIIGPYLMGVAIDDYIGTGDKTGLASTAGLMIANYLVMGLSAVAYGRIMARVSQQAMKTIRRDLATARKDLRAAWEIFQTDPGYEAHWHQAVARFTKKLELINRQISDFNLVAPSLSLHRSQLRLENDLRRLQDV